DNILFVIKPQGYTVAVNEKKQPAFYYIHKPDGSPASLKYPGVAPTGKLPKSVDFPLRAYDEPLNFTSLVFGDPQAYTEQEIEYFSGGIVSALKGVDNNGSVLSLGDHVGNEMVLHSPYIIAVNDIRVQW